MAVNAFRPSESDVGIVINWFPTETIRPMESLDDGGIGPPRVLRRLFGLSHAAMAGCSSMA